MSRRPARWFAALALGASSLGVTACATTDYLRYSDKLAEAERECDVDGRGAWLDHRRVTTPLLVGSVQDPASVGGRIEPFASYQVVNGLALPWFETGRFRSVDIYLDPRREARETWTWGPVSGSPKGVYAVELNDSADQNGCLDLARRSAATAQPAIDFDACMHFRYLGGLDISDRYIEISYRDERSVRNVYDRYVTEIRYGADHVVARSSAYVWEHLDAPCFRASGVPITDLLRREHPGG